jgi:hypothetical protein
MFVAKVHYALEPRRVQNRADIRNGVPQLIARYLRLLLSEFFIGAP